MKKLIHILLALAALAAIPVLAETSAQPGTARIGGDPKTDTGGPIPSKEDFAKLSDREVIAWCKTGVSIANRTQNSGRLNSRVSEIYVRVRAYVEPLEKDAKAQKIYDDASARAKDPLRGKKLQTTASANLNRTTAIRDYLQCCQGFLETKAYMDEYRPKPATPEEAASVPNSGNYPVVKIHGRIEVDYDAERRKIDAKYKDDPHNPAYASERREERDRSTHARSVDSRERGRRNREAWYKEHGETPPGSTATPPTDTGGTPGTSSGTSAGNGTKGAGEVLTKYPTPFGKGWVAATEAEKALIPNSGNYPVYKYEPDGHFMIWYLSRFLLIQNKYGAVDVKDTARQAARAAETAPEKANILRCNTADNAERARRKAAGIYVPPMSPAEAAAQKAGEAVW